MSDTNTQDDIAKFIRQSLLGVQLIDTQFHLFSVRSPSSGRVANPRVLAANNILLTKRSRFFSELLSSPTRPSDPALVDVGDIDRVPKEIKIDEYGYASDSDLDDDDDNATPGTANGNPELATRPEKSPKNIPETELANDEDGSSEAGSELFSSDILDLEPEASSHPRGRTSSDIAAHLRVAGSRHILVKDTAFQTWYTLLNYLYTGNVAFLPLKSSGTGARRSSTSHIDEPKCSPKSMYRLACKVDLDDLRDQAMAAICDGLTEDNVLQELTHSLVSRHPPLLEMTLDVLYSHIASPPIVTGLPSLATRIANKELPHGADIIVGLHSRILQQHNLLSPPPAAAPRSPVRLVPDMPATEEGETALPAAIETMPLEQIEATSLYQRELETDDGFLFAPPAPLFSFQIGSTSFSAPGRSAQVDLTSDLNVEGIPDTDEDVSRSTKNPIPLRDGAGGKKKRKK